MSGALYLYCFARAQAAPAADGELNTCRFEDLAAIYEWTEVELWSGRQAQARMAELEWLGPRVMRHQAVVASVMRNSPVLPARLGTLFSSAAALERFLASHRRTIARFLSEVAVHEEWAVKALLDRVAATEWLLSSQIAKTRTAAAAPGMRYLEERRMRTDAARELNRWVARVLEPVVDELRRHARDSRRRDVAAGAPEREPQTVLNLAFLVARDRVAHFRSRVEQAGRELGAQGLQLALSGPWPPYSFCPVLEMPP